MLCIILRARQTFKSTFILIDQTSRCEPKRFTVLFHIFVCILNLIITLLFIHQMKKKITLKQTIKWRHYLTTRPANGLLQDLWCRWLARFFLLLFSFFLSVYKHLMLLKLANNDWTTQFGFGFYLLTINGNSLLVNYRITIFAPYSQ